MATPGGTVRFDLEATEAKAVRAFLKVVDAQEKANKKAGQLNAKGKEATTTWQRFGQSSTQELTRMVAGIASVTGAVMLIKKAWELVTAEMLRSYAAQKKLGEASYTLDQAAKAVMNQLGGAATIATGQQRITEIMKSGRLADIGQAQGIAIAGNVAWGGLGAGQERGLVKTAAEFIGRKGLSAEAGGAFIEALSKMGAQTPRDVQRLSEQVWKGFTESSEKIGSNYILGLQKAAPEMMAAGAMPETVIAALTRGRSVKASSEEAAQMNRQILMALQRGNVQKALAAEGGMTREAFLGQGFEERFGQFGQWVGKYGATAKGQMLLGDILPGRELGRTRAYFAPEGMEEYKRVRQYLTGITAERFQQESARYAKMGIAGREEQRSKAEIDRVRADQMIKAGADLLLRADPWVDLVLAGTTDLPPEIDPGDVGWLRRSLVARDRKKSKQVLAKYALSQRRWEVMGQAERAGLIDVRKQARYALNRGFGPRQIEGYDYVAEPLTPAGRPYAEAFEAVEDLSPGRFTPGIGAAEIGRASMQLEALTEALNRNTAATNANAGGAPRAGATVRPAESLD